MSKKLTTILVRAGKGLSMPLIPGLAVDTNLTVITDQDEVQVLADHSFVRRCLRNGDLVLVEASPPTSDATETPSAKKKGKE